MWWRIQLERLVYAGQCGTSWGILVLHSPRLPTVSSVQAIFHQPPPTDTAWHTKLLIKLRSAPSNGSRCAVFSDVALYQSDIEGDLAPVGYTNGCLCAQIENGMQGVDLLQKGDLDIAEIGSPAATIALSPPRDLRVEIISVLYSDAESDALLVRDKIRTAKDFRGRTIATPPGSTSHYQLLYFLQLMNLANEVTVRLEVPSKLVELWQRGEIDGAFVWVRQSRHRLFIHTCHRMCM